jgi:RNA polymerase sigma factor (sigma-70 family)
VVVGADASAGHADRDLLWRALGRLPARQRAVLVLRYFEDLSEHQVAEALGVSVGTVKSQASRALAHLRATCPELAPRVGGEP